MRNKAIFAALLLASGSAHAATLVVTGQAENLGPNGVLPGSIQLFDPTLGTLNSVSIAALGYGNASVFNVAVDNGSGLETLTSATYTVSGSIDFLLAGVAGFTFALNPTTATTNSPFSFVAEAYGSSTIGVPSVQTANFYGTGATSLNVSGPVGISFDYSGPGQLQYSLGDFVNRVSLTVTYDYTPGAAAVPEPSTWAMAMTGFGLVGAAARRRKSQQAAV